MQDKLSIEEVAELVSNEGLDYAIQHYMDADSIADPKLAGLWGEAKTILAEISAIIYPDGIESWHDDENFDEDEDFFVDDDEEEKIK